MTSPRHLLARLRANVGRLRVDVEVELGEGPLVVVGANGAGKSSVLKLLLGALPLETGRIEVGSALLYDSELGVDLPVERRGLGYVPQNYALFPHFSVRRNLEFALTSAMPSLSLQARVQRIDDSLAKLGLSELGARAPGTLSGGEQQRVALARALIGSPRALLLDEPLAALDLHARRAVRSFLADYLRALPVPSVVVTHDVGDARVIGRRIAVLEAGRVVQLGTWAELAAAPATDFVRAFTADVGDS